MDGNLNCREMVTVVVIVTFWGGKFVFEMTKRGKKFNARTVG
jgi:hypothetical protein